MDPPLPWQSPYVSWMCVERSLTRWLTPGHPQQCILVPSWPRKIYVLQAHPSRIYITQVHPSSLYNFLNFIRKITFSYHFHFQVCVPVAIPLIINQNIYIMGFYSINISIYRRYIVFRTSNSHTYISCSWHCQLYTMSHHKCNWFNLMTTSC